MRSFEEPKIGQIWLYEINDAVFLFKIVKIGPNDSKLKLLKKYVKNTTTFTNTYTVGVEYSFTHDFYIHSKCWRLIK